MTGAGRAGASPDREVGQKDSANPGRCRHYSWQVQDGARGTSIDAPGSPGRTASEVIERVLAAYHALGELGESVVDEWQYVNDLVAVHTADLRALATADPGRTLRPAEISAVDLAIEEIGLIVDPHRAIDWLSTFPQIVRLAVGPVPRASPAPAGP